MERLTTVEVGERELQHLLLGFFTVNGWISVAKAFSKEAHLKRELDF